MFPETHELRIKSLKSRLLPLDDSARLAQAYPREAIAEILPHRPPFALLDAITALDMAQQMIVTETRIDEKDPVFEGHFPGQPIYPGVLQVEMMGQAGLCLIYFLQNQTTRIEAGQRPVKGLFTRIHNAGFIHPVYPGDTVTVRAGVIEHDDFLGVMGVQLCKGELICAHSILEAYLTD